MKTMFRWLHDNITNFDGYVNFYWLRNQIIDYFFEYFQRLHFEICQMESPSKLTVNLGKYTLPKIERESFEEFGIKYITDTNSLDFNLKIWMFLPLEKQFIALDTLEKSFKKLLKLYTLYS